MLYNLLTNLTGQRLIFPFYHTVSDISLPYAKHLFYIRTIKQFRKELDFFLTYYDPVDWKTVKEVVENQRRFKKNSFLLTFDDGMKEIYTIIAPILKEKGIPSVFFINPRFVDNKDIFYRFKISYILTYIHENKITQNQIQKIKSILGLNKNIEVLLMQLGFNDKDKIEQIAGILGIDFNDLLDELQPYLTTPQIKSLIKQGFSIGAHSLDHPLYSEVSYEEQVKQTYESVKWIENCFHIDYKLFSFPFADHFLQMHLFDRIYKETHLDMSFGTSGLKNDRIPYHFQRIAVEDSLWTAQWVIVCQYLRYMVKIFMNRNTLNR